MRKIAEVLRPKFKAKLSHDQIARAVGLSKGGVSKACRYDPQPNATYQGRKGWD